MDETDTAQSPVELLIVLAAIADEAFPSRPSLRNLAVASTRASITWETWPGLSANLHLDVAAIALCS